MQPLQVTPEMSVFLDGAHGGCEHDVVGSADRRAVRNDEAPLREMAALGGSESAAENRPVSGPNGPQLAPEFSDDAEDVDSTEEREMRKGGLEPPRVLPHRILNPARLPIPPLSRGEEQRGYLAVSPVHGQGEGDRQQSRSAFSFRELRPTFLAAR